MPYDLDFTVRITVQNDEEARLLQEAVYSGYAAEIMRIGVIYGQIPVMGAVSQDTAPTRNKTQQEIKRVESVHTSVSPKSETQQEPREKPKGVIGRKRLGRR